MISAESFEALVSEHYESLFRFAVSLARNESDAADLTQHTFYVWATKGHQLREPTKVKTWLFSTLYRAFLIWRRRQRRFANEQFEAVARDLVEPGIDPAKSADGPQVLAALARVDEVFRAPVALFYLEDLSYREIAKALNLPVGTVKSRISRGVAQLRKIMLAVDSSDRGTEWLQPGVSHWAVSGSPSWEPIALI